MTEIPKGWRNPLYTIEGNPHVYVRWADRDVPVLTSVVPAWHENRSKGHEEAWELLNAVVQCVNSAPTLATELEAARARIAVLEALADETRKYRLLLLDPEPGLASWNIALTEATQKVDAALRAALSGDTT